MLNSFSKLSADEIIDMIQVNITSMAMMTRIILPQMEARGRGAIINLASALNTASQPQADDGLQSFFTATKAFVYSLSTCLGKS